MPSKFNSLRPLSLFRALLFCKTRDYRQNLKDPKLSPEVS